LLLPREQIAFTARSITHFQAPTSLTQGSGATTINGAIRPLDQSGAQPNCDCPPVMGVAAIFIGVGETRAGSKEN